MKKTYMLILSVICVLCLFSAAAAYDSLFDKSNNTAPEAAPFKSIKQGLIPAGQSTEPDTKTVTPYDSPAADFNTTQPGELRREGSLVIDSIEPLIEADDQTLSVFQMFSGLRFDYVNQTGSVPMTSFNLSLSDYPIFSYALQKTNPYFVSSNFLGENTYMIYEDDKFEEKLVDAVYRMVEKSDTQTELPDINEVYAIIQSFRDGSINVSPIPMQQSFEFTQEIDTSAFDPVMMTVMMRFAEGTPAAENNYFFTDIPQEKRSFSWPAIETLPELKAGSSAISATFTQQDLQIILNALSQFLTDNPELAEAVNKAIITSMAQTNPQMAQMEGVDILSELISGLQESAATDLKDFTLIFNMDQDMYGAPVLFRVELINRTETETTDTVIRFHMTDDFSAFEAAVDSIQDQQTLPVIRMLAVNNTDDDVSNIKLNFRIDNAEGTAFEYAQISESHTTAAMTSMGNDEINFDLNGERGNATVFTTGIPNAYGGEDKTTQIIYTHTSQGTPLFKATIIGESKTTEALPGLTEADAVAVSQMSESDYDTLVSNFFMNIMMLSMIFS